MSDYFTEVITLHRWQLWLTIWGTEAIAIAVWEVMMRPAIKELRKRTTVEQP